MRGAGADRIIPALLSAPRMRAGAYMAALPYMIAERERDKAYRIYISDALRAIGENSARGGGKYYETRFIDLIEPKAEEKRTAEEVIDQVRGTLRRLQEGSEGT